MLAEEMSLDGGGCPRLERSGYRFFKIDFAGVLFMLGTGILDCEIGRVFCAVITNIVRFSSFEIGSSNSC